MEVLMHGLFPYLINAFINLELYRWPVVRKTISTCVVLFQSVPECSWSILKNTLFQVVCTTNECCWCWCLKQLHNNKPLSNGEKIAEMLSLSVVVDIVDYYFDSSDTGWTNPLVIHINAFLNTPTWKQTAPWPQGKWSHGGNSGTAVKPQPC